MPARLEDSQRQEIARVALAHLRSKVDPETGIGVISLGREISHAVRAFQIGRASVKIWLKGCGYIRVINVAGTSSTWWIKMTGNITAAEISAFLKSRRIPAYPQTEDAAIIRIKQLEEQLKDRDRSIAKLKQQLAALIGLS